MEAYDHTILDQSARLLEDTTFNDDQRDQLRIIKEQGARLAGVIGRAVPRVILPDFDYKRRSADPRPAERRPAERRPPGRRPSERRPGSAPSQERPA